MDRQCLGGGIGFAVFKKRAGVQIVAAALGIIAIAILLNAVSHRSAGGGRVTTTIGRQSTTVPSVSSSTLSASAKNLVAVLQRRNEVFRSEPDPSLIDSYMAKSSEAYDDEKQLLTTLHENNQHVDSELLDVLGIRLNEHKAVYVTATIVASSKSNNVVDKNNKFVYSLGSATEPTGYVVSYIFVDGWKIASINRVDLSAATRKAVLASGVS